MRALLLAVVTISALAPTRADALNRAGPASPGLCYASGTSGPTVPCVQDGVAWSRVLRPTDPADALTVLLPAAGAVSRTVRQHLDAAPLPASLFGAVCDGATDDSAAIRAGIAAARAHSRLTLVLPQGVCAIGSTITTPDWSNVTLIGGGVGVGAGSGGNSADGTVLKWVGPIDGTMLDWQSPTAPVGHLTASSSIVGITLDGAGAAGTGLYARGLYNSRLGLKFRNVRTVGVDIDVYAGGGADVQQNDILYINGDLNFPNSVNAKGVVFGPGNSYNNVHHNVIRSISVIHQAGTGVEVGNADSNTFMSLQAQWPVDGSGARTGIGLDLRASPGAPGPGGITQAARDNVFLNVSVASGTYARAGSSGWPTYGNMIFGYIQGSGEPEPVIESGAKLHWFTSYGIMHNFARFEADDGAWLMGGRNCSNAGVCLPAAKQFASLAEFGTDRPLYITGPNPGLGYNARYTFGGYVFGPNSTGHYAGVNNFDTVSGDFITSCTANPGNANNPITFAECGRVGARGARLAPSLPAAPASPYEGQTYYDTTLHKYRAWDGSGWNNFW